MMSTKQKEAYQRLLEWAEREGKITTHTRMRDEEKAYNDGQFGKGNTARPERYAGWRFGSFKATKPKPNQAITIRKAK